uniref:Target of rapamycin complex subunit lst8 n=1 Tax=Seriola dumerili TaxID=41447 RepID=A0A3B4TP59_SERDU
MNVNQGTVGSDPVILATAGYDHTVRFWQAHSGICTRTVQHQDSQVNSLEVTPDRSMIAAALHIRMYDLNSNNPNPVINYDGVSKNITSVGFHEDGRWMYCRAIFVFRIGLSCYVFYIYNRNGNGVRVV